MTPEEFAKRYKSVVDQAVLKLKTSIAHSQVVHVVDEPIESHRSDSSSLLPM